MAKAKAGVELVSIPALQQKAAVLRLVGDSPLLVNNKMSTAWKVAERYSGGGVTKKPKAAELSPDEQYAGAFYVLPSSPVKPPSPEGLYGVPASGIRKCLQKGIRQAGFSDNTAIGVIGKSFRVSDDEGGLVLIRHNGFVRDARPVNIGSGQKTVPSIRYRPLFAEWELHVRVVFNANVLSYDQLVNLAMYAGQYIGLCELRNEKLQGECGGFMAADNAAAPDWASDRAWGVRITPQNGFVVNGKSRKRSK